MRFLMVLVLIGILAMTFVSASPVPAPDGEVIIIVNQQPQNPDYWYYTTSIAA
ncbi:uncharacterized protein LOC108039187 [Drosophila rhopaloa]|uniref:Uncharacterized protein LOC108039187 n=1 Tax=Drosophila rhopaloa TaxID=1041015 RepID=A0A6P4EE66_DRORH|nr:uncharacterized protein LOC108039187 [Drosophila rhopaloa]